jgi:hypothetical protein
MGNVCIFPPTKFGTVIAAKQVLGAQETAAEMHIEIDECHE